MTTKPRNLTRASNITAIERATGKPWGEWVAFFEAHDAAAKSHGEIAVLGRTQMPEGLENPDWWAQAVSIAFEQHAGLRVPGQSASGTFRVSVSRTVSVDRDVAISQWIAAYGDTPEHLGYIAADPRESRTEKRTFYRFKLEGAGKVEISATPKVPDKSGVTKTTLGVAHDGLVSEEQLETWRGHWKESLIQIGD